MQYRVPLHVWSGLGRSKQAALLIASAAAAVIALAFVAAMRDTRVAVFPNALRSDQVAEVSERLAAWNIPHAVGTDNVRVEARRRNDILLRLSLAGIPHDHVASSREVLAGVGALTPQSIIDAQTREGLGGDLALALRGIDGVADARVIIAPAQHGVFADEASHEASASVRLMLHAGAELAPQATAGIRAFIAAAVPGLTPERVTIVDDRGVALGDTLGEAGEGQELQRSLQSALDGAFGAGTTIVRVHAILDPRAIDTHDLRSEPALKRAIAGARIDERFAGEGKRYSKTTSQEERGRDVHESHTTLPAGRVARVSVAVFVDERRAGELDKIKELAAATVGIDRARGDVLTVQPVTFAAAAALTAHPWISVYGAIAPALPICFGAIVFFAVTRSAREPIAVLVRAALRRIATVQTRAAAPSFTPHEVRAALQGEPAHTAAAVIGALPAASAAAVLDLFTPEERAAIVRRMSRAHSSLVHEAINAR